MRDLTGSYGAILPATIQGFILGGRQPPGLSLHQINKAQLSPDFYSQSQALDLTLDAKASPGPTLYG